MKILMIIVCIVLVFFIGFFIGRLTNNMYSEVFSLKKPLKVVSDIDEGILPKGTVLYYVKSMSEGFDVYKIYVNKEGEKFKLKKTDKKWLIAPIWIKED